MSGVVFAQGSVYLGDLFKHFLIQHVTRVIHVISSAIGAVPMYLEILLL